MREVVEVAGVAGVVDFVSVGGAMTLADLGSVEGATRLDGGSGGVFDEEALIAALIRKAEKEGKIRSGSCCRAKHKQ